MKQRSFYQTKNVITWWCPNWSTLVMWCGETCRQWCKIHAPNVSITEVTKLIYQKGFRIVSLGGGGLLRQLRATAFAEFYGVLFFSCSSEMHDQCLNHIQVSSTRTVTCSSSQPKEFWVGARPKLGTTDLYYHTVDPISGGKGGYRTGAEERNIGSVQRSQLAGTVYEARRDLYTYPLPLIISWNKY
jgi:hypothetical protein